jgi:type III restriction enzyme
MGLHPEFPESPYDILNPETRWFPADESLRDRAYDKLMPPLVAKVRQEVALWRAKKYADASPTSKALLQWWFETDHTVYDQPDLATPFRYFFAQREAVESVIYLFDVRKARDKYDLIRFDSSELVSSGMFSEDWPRYVVKMATGAGKTKVLSLLMAWSYFHRRYEPDSGLSRNFLLVAPNIIVLDRLRADFDGLKIFFNDPILPANGFEGQNWRDDFQMVVHIQDDVRIVRPTGNIFLSNIHRVFLGEPQVPSLGDDDLADYFLGEFGNRPKGKTTDSQTDLGEIVRQLDELAVLNDEAHHIHNDKMAWFSSIRDIHHRMVQRDTRLALQLDVTATPKHDNGAIFVQTIADYPLVEAIHQRVVKHPVLPPQDQLDKLHEAQSAIFTEKYADHLKLGVEEWRRTTQDHEKVGKKAVLFVMVDDTRNCDEVGGFLEKIAPELEGKVLVIHTKANGEISEAASGKSKAELEMLRREANSIDSFESKHRAVVSVMMLREGWDVRNVTTIVGLRAYNSPAKILPEQTLGRGLRLMYRDPIYTESLSVIGTPAFIEFVESLTQEGIVFERATMGAQGARKDTLIIEVDPEKDQDTLDIPLPRLEQRFAREYKDLDALDISAFQNPRIPLKPFSEEQTREIIFKFLLTDEISHTVELDGTGPGDWRSMVAWFARGILKKLSLVGGYELLYPAVRDFLRTGLFEPTPVDLDDPVVLRNIAEPDATKITFDTFLAAINALTIQDRGTSRIVDRIRIQRTRPFATEYRPSLEAPNCPFNRVVGEAQAGGLELRFAAFLRDCPEVLSFTKNYQQVGFSLDYVKTDGSLSNYIPDFLARDQDNVVWIIETKGREELDLPRKMDRLRQWCQNATAALADVDPRLFPPAERPTRYDLLYVDQQSFDQTPPKDFTGLVAAFREYRD